MVSLVASNSTSEDLRDRSLGELMRQLADETTTLLRKEIELVRAELGQKIETVKAEASETGSVARVELSEAAQRTRADASARVGHLKSELSETRRAAGADFSRATEQAKKEVSERGKQGGAGAGMLGAAAGFALLTLGTLTAFLILALDGIMPNWLAALIVAAVYAVVTAVLFSVGRDRIRRAWPLVTNRTTQAFTQAAGGAVARSKEGVASAWPPVSAQTVQAAREDIAAAIARGKQGAQQVWPPVPEQTVETLKEDVQWAKTQT